MKRSEYLMLFVKLEQVREDREDWEDLLDQSVTYYQVSMANYNRLSSILDPGDPGLIEAAESVDLDLYSIETCRKNIEKYTAKVKYLEDRIARARRLFDPQDANLKRIAAEIIDFNQQ